MNNNTRTPIDRRRLLLLAGASATTLWLPRSAWSQPRLAANPFALGVASGSPTHDGVVLWTRLVSSGLLGVGTLSQGPVTVRWEVAHDEGFRRIAQAGQAEALPELAHSLHVEVQGLEADRWYFYRFMVGGSGNDWVSPVGRTRTFPAAGAQAARLRLAYASCQRWEHGYYAAYRHMLRESLDVVMFLGDYIYEYPGASEPARRVSGGWVVTLDDYRARYALHKTDEDLQAMHAACPWIVTWDDHEVQNDYAGLTAGNAGPSPADFASRRAAAYQAYYEHMPLRSSVLTRAFGGLQQGAEMRIYGRVAFGRLANLHWLDDRQYRHAQACTPEGRLGSASLNTKSCAIWQDPARTLLGTEQEAWVDGAFAQSAGATWNVIGQQSVFGRRDFSPGPGEFMWNDGWDGYTPARHRFLASMQKHSVPNPVLLGGDVHENWVGHVKADYTRPDSAALGVEFCGTSITSRTSVSPKQAEWLAENPHFVYANGEKRGYGVVEFTPAQITTTLRAVDDVTRRDSGVQTLAQFVVQAGRAQLQRTGQ